MNYFKRTIAVALLAAPLTSRADLGPLFTALRAVEQPTTCPAVEGDNKEAIGPYQIHQSFWLDSCVSGEYNMCRDEAYARRVVLAYWARYCPEALKAENFEVLARTVNGGPAGARKQSTLGYWEKVRHQLPTTQPGK